MTAPAAATVADPAGRSPAIAIRNLRKRHGARTILDDLGFELPVGQRCGLAGLNGAGKTTLLKCLLGFQRPSAGSIELFGMTSALPQARRNLAYLPENFAPPGLLRGGALLRYLLRIHGVEPAPSRIGQILEGLDFQPTMLGRRIATYSKGMTQKIGLAACLLSNKRLLLLDEPMSGLDPRARMLLKQQLGAYCANGENSLLMVSHLLMDFAEICDLIAILHGGILKFVGSPRACQQQYAATDLEQAFTRCIEDDETRHTAPTHHH